MIHKKLADLRKSKGLSQVQMAKLIAMEQTTYSRKETGKSTITNEEWIRFAKVLEVNVDEIKEGNNTGLKNNSAKVDYVTIPQNLLDILIKYNQKLEAENQSLKQNS